jgi:hypothetical protein
MTDQKSEIGRQVSYVFETHDHLFRKRKKR